jgi:hypothetical protein
VISVGLQVGIPHGTLEGEIKSSLYIVMMTVTLLCNDGMTQHLFASWSLLTMVIVNRGSGGMELTAPIIIVDSGVGGLCQQQPSSTKAAVGCSQQHQLLSLTAALVVFVDNCRH